MNIIYIVCHDLGRHLGCYGRPTKTPHIDAFARQAVRCDRAFCSTGVCSPSRAACLTGLHAHRNGLMGLAHFGWRYSPGVKTIVDYFNEADFETVHCGLSHEGEEGASRYQTDFEVSWDSQLAENAVDDAVAWLRARKKQGRTTPFYMNIGTREVHPVVWRRDRDADGRPSRFQQVYGGPVPLNEASLAPPTPDIPILREDFARFESAIRFFDSQMGRLFGELERLGVYEDTMVVFTTDHGMNDWHGKGCPYDRGSEIALLIRPPGAVLESAVFPRLIQNIDVTPTLLEAAGVPVPPGLDGRSFWPALAGGDCAPHEFIVYEWNFGGPQDDYSPIRSLRTEKWKLVRNFGPHNYDLRHLEEIAPDFTNEVRHARRFKDYGRDFEHPTRFAPEFELYDLTNDPHELHNLAENPEHSALRKELEALLHSWMVENNDHVLCGEVPRIPAPPGEGERFI